MPFGMQTRWLRYAGCAAGLGCLAALCHAEAVGRSIAGSRRAAQKRVVALSPWAQAERWREELEALPEPTRTRAAYTHAEDAYRAIYHDHPGDVHAPAAIDAVAELLAEQGRSLHDAKCSKAAIGQYEFLRTQYPGSSLRVQALLAEGQIEENDLDEPSAARDRYKLLLKDYPRSDRAEEAHAGLASLESQAVAASQSPGRPDAHASGQVRARASLPSHFIASEDAGGNGTASTPTALPPMATTAQTSLPRGSLPPQDAGHGSGEAQGADLHPSAQESSRSALLNSGAKKGGQPALVTSIRHWSTATYTRVAIDLGEGVTYEAARVPNPDRIYFDLHGTQLAPELVGKSFNVTDDGFLKKIRAAQAGEDTTRVVLDVNDVAEYSAFLLPNPYRLIIDIHGARSGPPPITIGAVQRRAEATPAVPNTTAVRQASSTDVAEVSEVPGRVEATTRPTSKPISAVVPATRQGETGGDLTPAAQPALALGTRTKDQPIGTAPGAPNSAKKSRKTRGNPPSVSTVADATPARAAVPTADGETSLVRALGLKIGRIVIDAGHGGHDSGTLGADGIQEKDVVLDVALRVGAMLHERLGAEIIYTRSDDTFIPLETRTAIANKAQADLFLSIHANSSPDPSARGVETYYLNFTSDPAALDVAARENAVSDQSIHQLSDLVKKIALKDKIAESREFAGDVEQSLYSGLQRGNAGLKDRGVKQAPFVVLIGANMPSILAEISFVTNPKDADQLLDPDYRQRVAESLYKGVARYEAGLSGNRETTMERASTGR
jgi:N-acetylmuramoyl-L-alanine amidase